MGSLEELIAVAKSLEGKIDTLTAALAANGGALPETSKATRSKKTVETPATPAATTSFTDKQIADEFDRIKALPKAETPELKKIIQGLGFGTLAELRQAPAKFDEAMAALKAYEASLSGQAEDDL